MIGVFSRCVDGGHDGCCGNPADRASDGRGQGRGNGADDMGSDGGGASAVDHGHLIQIQFSAIHGFYLLYHLQSYFCQALIALT